MTEYTLLGYDSIGLPLSILVQKSAKSKCESERDNIYRPAFGGLYEVVKTSFVFEYRGVVFRQLGKGRDCVWAYEDRVRFGTKEDIQSDIDLVLDFGALPPKGEIF